MQLTCQELRDAIAWEVANSYSPEINKLETRLSDLKVKVQSINN